MRPFGNPTERVASTLNAGPDILLLDDEPAVLDGISRRLGSDYRLSLMSDPFRALETISAGEKFAVILADMKMPGMDGLTFIRQAREHSPFTVFLMLTGNQDLPSATRALNEGQVFRYFTKPCSNIDLRSGLDAALKQWELIQAERELLERTFVGSVNILCDIMGIAQPLLTVVNERLQRLIRSACTSLGWKAHWEMMVAAKLALVGFVVVPPEQLVKFFADSPFSSIELELYQRSLETSARLLAQIPRLNRISALVDRMRTTNGAILNGHLGANSQNPRELHIENGGTLLGMALAHVIGTRKFGVDSSLNRAMEQLYVAPDARLLHILRSSDAGPSSLTAIQSLALGELVPGMVLAEDFRPNSLQMSLRAGDVLTNVALAHLHSMPEMKPMLDICLTV